MIFHPVDGLVEVMTRRSVLHPGWIVVMAHNGKDTQHDLVHRTNNIVLEKQTVLLGEL